jgi:hypothetical protein
MPVLPNEDIAKDGKRDSAAKLEHHQRKAKYHKAKKQLHAEQAKKCKNDGKLCKHTKAFDLHGAALIKHLEACAAIERGDAKAHEKSHRADRASKQANTESEAADKEGWRDAASVVVNEDDAMQEDVAAKAKNRKYYTLLEKLPSGRFRGVWTIQFGDYDRSVVVQEMNDMRENGGFVKGTKFKIIATGHTQAEIDAVVAELNGGKTMDKAQLGVDIQAAAKNFEEDLALRSNLQDLASKSKHPLKEAIRYKSQHRVATHKYDEERPTRIRSTVQFGHEKMENQSVVKPGDHLYFGAIRKIKGQRPKMEVYHHSKSGTSHMHHLGKEAATKLKAKCKAHGKACTV